MYESSLFSSLKTAREAPRRVVVAVLVEDTWEVCSGSECLLLFLLVVHGPKTAAAAAASKLASSAWTDDVSMP